jgi:amidase
MGNSRKVVIAAALVCAACGNSDSSSFDFDNATVESVRNGLAAGQVTCRALVQHHLDRIAALNRNGPQLHAVLDVNPDALSIADALDRSYAQSGPRGSLHCVPLLVKDNFNTGDSMATTAGSLTMQDFHAPEDAFSIAKLRAAGAVPIAKTHMDEWAQGAAGYGSRGGQMPNAHKLDRIPGGSSGGSAIGIASGMGVIATGSDTGGSIRIPAALNGVVGIKPTLGLVGRTGIIPSSSEFDVAGPITRTVADAAAMLGVMTGVDAGDAATTASAGRSSSDYARFLDANGLAGAKLGLLVSFYDEPLVGNNTEFDAAMDEAVATMASRGAAITPKVSMPAISSPDDLIAMIGTLGIGHFDHELSDYFARYRHPTLHSLGDVVAQARVLGPDVVKILPKLEGALQGQEPGDAAFASAQALRSKFIAALAKTMDDAQVDALVFLTMTCPATPLPGVVDPGFKCKPATPMPYTFGEGFGGEQVLMASLSGYPEITVPAGFTSDGVPIAVSFLGRPFSEATLIRIAYAYEQASVKRRAPRFLP